jgi:hypothetical protein
LNLNGYTNPRLRFQTKYNIEEDYDYGQVQVSTNNGTTWIALEGEFTEPGVGSFQPEGEPLYDGSNANWIKEEINLTSYISSQFKIRFRLRTDGGTTLDGWYVDDIGIFIYSIPTDILNDAETVFEFSLEQNYPNPFNPSTIIKYSIPSVIASGSKQSQLVTLKIYDVLGNEVATLVNEEKPAGSYEVEFSAKGGSASGGNAYKLSSGIYFYRLQAGSFVETKKLILMK